MILKASGEFPQERGLRVNREEETVRPLRNANVGSGNESLRRRLRRSGWRVSKKAREGKTGELQGQKGKRGKEQMLLQVQEW